MKSRFTLLLAASAAFATFNAAQAQTKWDMPTPYADGEFHTRNVKAFVEDVKKATNGALEITVRQRSQQVVCDALDAARRASEHVGADEMGRVPSRSVLLVVEPLVGQGV